MKPKKPIHYQTEHGNSQREAIMTALRTGAKTSTQLCALLGIARSPLNRHIVRLREDKKIYTIGFQMCRGKGSPIHALGHHPDAVFVVKARHLRIAPEPALPTIPTTQQSWLAALGL